MHILREVPVKPRDRLLHPFITKTRAPKFQGSPSHQSDYQINQVIRSIRSGGRGGGGREVNDLALVLISGRKSSASQLNVLGSHRETEGKKERKK